MRTLDTVLLCLTGLCAWPVQSAIGFGLGFACLAVLPSCSQAVATLGLCGCISDSHNEVTGFQSDRQCQPRYLAPSC
ncbi:MAG: hypothetical protein RR135_06000 [Oscillospiraceae bacterium]